MRSKLFAPGLAVVTLSVAACGSSGSNSIAARPGRASGGRPTRVYRVQLSGTAETLPGAPHGSGAAVIAFHGDSMVCWRFAHLHGFTNATFAHIHIGVKGRSGNVVASVGFGVHNSWVRTEDLVRELTPMLHNTASEISARVGYH